MAANRFDQAAEMPIINTYVPIDFGNLYRIGATQKAAVDQALSDLTSAVSTFGEFRSPSTTDTQNYYKLSLGQMQDLLDEAAADPNSMKDPGFRARFYSRLNNLDYSNLSLLRESANNLRKGLAIRAEMEAKGLYNESWDDANIAQYDTLGQGAVFTDITPVAYMNANQLSQPYFDNLSKGTIDSTWKDGIKYTITGNTVDDLRAIANARYSDMVNTPQGQKYYEQFLRQNGGDAQAAERQFKEMIVASQMDRTLRPTLTVDPAWLANMKASTRSNGSSALAQMANRLDYMQRSFTRIGNDNLRRSLTPEQNAEFGNIRAQLNKDYLEKLQRADQTGSEEDLVAMREAQNRLYEFEGQAIRDANRRAVLNGFEQKAGYSADNASNNQKHGNDLYLSGIEYGLSKAEQQVALKGDKEALFTNLGGTYQNIQNKGASSIGGFSFMNTNGFILPETVFRQVTSTVDDQGNLQTLGLRGDVTRAAGIGRSEEFPFQELVESGQFSNVQFIPEGKMIQNGTFDYALKGKLRIPREEVERYLGTGVWGNAGSEGPSNLATDIAAGADYLFTPFGRYGTLYNLEDKYNAKLVTEIQGDDEVDYIEVDAYRQLPNTYKNGEWWKSTLQTWQNSPSSGGIGGSSQAKDAYNDPIDPFLN